MTRVALYNAIVLFAAACAVAVYLGAASEKRVRAAYLLTTQRATGAEHSLISKMESRLESARFRKNLSLLNSTMSDFDREKQKVEAIENEIHRTKD